MSEEWRTIDGYSGRYSVSDMGSVKSDRILIAQENRVGYLKLVLYGQNSVRRFVSVHRLVVEAFLRKPSYFFTEVNHIDGCKSNVILENLEWTSPMRNKIHAVQNGLQPSQTDYFGISRSRKGTWICHTPVPFGGKHFGGYPSAERATREYDKWVKHYKYHEDPYWCPLNFEEIIVPRIYKEA